MRQLTVTRFALFAGIAALFTLSPAIAQPGPRGNGPRHQPPSDVTPEEVAANCIERVTRVSEYCAQRNEDLGAMAVARINELLEAGEEEEAIALAERTVGYVHKGSRRCAHRVAHHCRRCVHLLNRLEADEALIADVEAVCETALDLIRTSAKTAVQEISDAVGVDFTEMDEDDLPEDGLE